jgi:hypothetical protein
VLDYDALGQPRHFKPTLFFQNKLMLPNASSSLQCKVHRPKSIARACVAGGFVVVKRLALFSLLLPSTTVAAMLSSFASLLLGFFKKINIYILIVVPLLLFSAFCFTIPFFSILFCWLLGL